MNYKSYQQVFSLASEVPRTTAAEASLAAIACPVSPSSTVPSSKFNPQLYTPPHSPRLTFHSSCPSSPLLTAHSELEEKGLPKKRTKTGCFTCRSRKKKCDEHIDPVSGKCTGCTRNFLECSWPESNLTAVELTTCVVGKTVSHPIAKTACIAKPKGRTTASKLALGPVQCNKMAITHLLNEPKPLPATRFVIVTS